MRKMFYIIVCIMVIFTGCNGLRYSQSLPFISYSKVELNPPIVQRGPLTPVFLLDDSVIFLHVVVEDDVAFGGSGYIEFYRYYFGVGELLEIYAPFDFVIATGQLFLLDDVLFFYPGIRENGGILAVLFGIDLENNKIVRFTEGAYQTRPIIYATTHNGKIISLKNRRDGDIATSYIEVYNPETNSTKIISEGVAYISDNVGIVYSQITSNNEMIYILYASRETVDCEWSHKLRIYDRGMNFFKTMDINDVAGVMSTFISEFRVIGDYLYVQNYSNEVVIWYIDDAEGISIVREWRIPQTFTDELLHFLVSERHNKNARSSP